MSPTKCLDEHGVSYWLRAGAGDPCQSRSHVEPPTATLVYWQRGTKLGTGGPSPSPRQKLDILPKLRRPQNEYIPQNLVLIQPMTTSATTGAGSIKNARFPTAHIAS